MKLLGAIIEGEDIVNKKYVDDGLFQKQGTLTAGDGITINNNTISANEVFIAIYEQTSYADVKSAIDENKVIVLKMTANNNQFCMTYSTYTNGGNALMYAIYKMNDRSTLMTATLTPQNQWTVSHTDLQDKLVSGTNIKTVNNLSLLGSGNIDIEGGGGDNTWIVAQVDVTTYNEVETAVLSNKSIVVKTSNSSYYDLYPMLDVDSNGDDRIAIHIEHGTYYVTNDDVWTYSDNGELVENYTLNLRTGALQDLDTDDKSNLVNAINEVHTKSSAVATETAAGIVKLNPSESITLNANGQLQVGGRLGQFPNGGVFYPTTIEPTGVGASSFLMSDGAKGISVTQRTFAIMAGAGVTCKSAAAGSTTYRVSNTQSNRFLLAAVVGGRAALNQADATANGTAAIVSIKYADGGDLIVPKFGATESSNDIIITLSRSINPSAATTTLRVYGKNNSGDNILVGQGVGAKGGKALSLGQSTYAGGNQNIAFGNSVYTNANNSVGFGHTMLVNKQYCLGAGQGHDFTNGANGTTAVGVWSEITNKTKFVVGNGTADVRSNIFEVQDNAGATEVIMKSPNGTKYKLTVDDSGNLTTTAV